MKVAACQMVSGASLAHNLATAEQLLAQAADAGAELAVLPEYFCLLGLSENDKLSVAESARMSRRAIDSSSASTPVSPWALAATFAGST